MKVDVLVLNGQQIKKENEDAERFKNPGCVPVPGLGLFRCPASPPDLGKIFHFPSEGLLCPEAMVAANNEFGQTRLKLETGPRHSRRQLLDKRVIAYLHVFDT